MTKLTHAVATPTIAKELEVSKRVFRKVAETIPDTKGRGPFRQEDGRRADGVLAQSAAVVVRLLAARCADVCGHEHGE